MPGVDLTVVDREDGVLCHKCGRHTATEYRGVFTDAADPTQEVARRSWIYCPHCDEDATP